MSKLKGQAGVAAGVLAIVVAVVAVANIANLQPSGKAIATSGLVGDWNFDSGTGADSSPNGNTGETGPGAQIVASTYGKALELDGTGAYLRVPNSPSMSNLRTFTTSLWFNQVAQGKQQVLVNKPYAQLYIDTSGQLHSYIGAKNCASGNAISTNRWYHAAVSYDGSNVKMYLDGKPIKSCQSAGGDASTQELYIGADSQPLQFFKGQIDEVKIYNRVLVDSDVKELCGTICTTTTPSTTPTTQAQLPSPTLYWNFDEGSGATATDSSGTKAAGIAGALWDDGKFGKSLEFGQNKYASLPLPSEITQMTSITLSAWVKSTGAGNGIIINGAPSSQAQYGHGAYLTLTGGYPHFRKGISGYVDTLPGTKAITDTNWHLVTATYDATATSASSNGIMKIYLDGEEIGSKPASSSGIDWANYGGYPNPSQLYIGAIKTNQYGSGDTVPDSTFFSGSIDEVRIYDKALSGEQVMALKNHVPPPPATPTPPPAPTAILYWNFDEGSGTSAKDSIANLVGSADWPAYIGTPPNGVFEQSGPSWVQGKTSNFGNALSFDGRNDYVGLPLPASVKTQAITLSAWVQSPENGIILAAEPGGAGQYALGAHIAFSGGRPYFNKGTQRGAWESLSSSKEIADSNWHHVAATYDGSVMKIYLDGEATGSLAQLGGIKWDDVPGSYPNPAMLYIGAFRTNNELDFAHQPSPDLQYFKGSIDEVKIFSGAMSADQIKELYSLVPQEPQKTLTIVRAGSGSGTVTSSPPGIDCGTTCAADFTASTQITLTSSPSAGSTFTGWSGTDANPLNCPGTGTCTVTLAADTAVTAQFVAAATQLDVGFLLAASLKLEVLRAIFDASIKQGNEMIIYWSDPQKGNNPTTTNKWRQINDALGNLGSKMAVIQESINREKDNPTQQGVNKIRADINQLNADIAGLLASI